MRIILALACFSLAIFTPTALSSPDHFTPGPVSVVLNNDLDPSTPGLPALLLSPPRPYSTALANCALLNEQLLEVSTHAHPRDAGIALIVNGLQSRLKYSKSPRTKKDRMSGHHDIYWISNNGSKANETLCIALAVTGPGTGKITTYTCTHRFPALCSNSNVQSNITAPVPKLAKVLVDTAVGTFMGFRTQQSFTFRGIKYAEAKRFQSPAPYVPPNGTIYDATTFGSVCPQLVENKIAVGVEDCLFLNIYTPTLPGSEDLRRTGLPVMFFIHGGAYLYGEGSFSAYNGQNLANRGNVVVVTINYRLGLLGFFDGTFSGFPHSVIPGNQAPRDWIAALEWVRQNIAYFGGSPNKVTIFGHSAGGTSVRTLLSIPSAKGLFHSAILQSDPIDYPLNSLETGSGNVGADYVKLLNCTQGDLACVTGQNVSDVVLYADMVAEDAVKKNSHLTKYEAFKPVIDGELIPKDFYDLVKTGKEHHVPIMIGTVRDEANYFVPYLLPPNTSEVFIPIALNQIFGVNRSKIINDSDLYHPDPNKTDNVRYLIGQIVTDGFWTCPTQYMMSVHKAINNVYVYVMNRGYGVPVKYGGEKFCVGYVCHSFDVLDVFGSQDLNGLTDPTDYTADDVKYARIVQDRWIAFAHTGTPNPPFPTDVDVVWPKYTRANPNVMQLDLVPRVTSGYRRKFCCLMDKIKYDFQLNDQ